MPKHTEKQHKERKQKTERAPRHRDHGDESHHHKGDEPNIYFIGFVLFLVGAIGFGIGIIFAAQGIAAYASLAGFYAEWGISSWGWGAGYEVVWLIAYIVGLGLCLYLARWCYRRMR